MQSNELNRTSTRARHALPCLALVLLTTVSTSAIPAAAAEPARPKIRRLPALLQPTESVTTVAHLQAVEETPVRPAVELQKPQNAGQTEQVPSPQPIAQDDNAFVVDLATAFRLGGARSLQIQIARQRTVQAEIEWRKAQSLLLPNLWMGVGWNRHNGRIQATEGDIIEAGRNSLFTGGGAGLSGAPVAGGSGGPARLFVNLSLADAHFEPLVARQLLDATDAAEQRDINDTMLDIATAYFDLLEARSLLANIRQAAADSESMVEQANEFFDAGKLAESETLRAKTEELLWQRRAQNARRVVVVRMAELARLLRLSYSTQLIPAEAQIFPVAVIDDSLALDQLVAMGLSARPELVQHEALVQARMQQLRQERTRPFLPNVQLGASGGSFGGGRSSNYDNEGSRSDVDVLAVWELRNMGLGNLQLQRQRCSQLEQSELLIEQLEDRVVTDIVQANADVDNYFQQIDVSRQATEAAEKSYQANIRRVRDAVGLPIEMLQAIRARVEARNTYTRSISDYNRAQYRLLYAVGEPPVDVSH